MGTRIRDVTGLDYRVILMTLFAGMGIIKIEKDDSVEPPKIQKPSNSKPAPLFLMCPFDIDKSIDKSIAVTAKDPLEFIPVFNSIAKHNGVSGTKIRGLHLALDKKTFENPPYIQVNISSGKVIGINNGGLDGQGWKKLDLMQGDFLVILGRDTGKRAGRIMLVPEETLRTTRDHSGNPNELEAIRRKLSWIDTAQFLGYT